MELPKEHYKVSLNKLVYRLKDFLRKLTSKHLNYFETVCNEIGKVESLRREIEKVVFQYIPEEKRLKKNSFKGVAGK